MWNSNHLYYCSTYNLVTLFFTFDHIVTYILINLTKYALPTMFLRFAPLKKFLLGAVVVAQLVERSLPIPEVHSSNPVIRKNLFTYWTFVYCQLCFEKKKIKKKRPGMAHLKNKQILIVLISLDHCTDSHKSSERWQNQMSSRRSVTFARKTKRLASSSMTSFRTTEFYFFGNVSSRRRETLFAWKHFKFCLFWSHLCCAATLGKTTFSRKTIWRVKTASRPLIGSMACWGISRQKYSDPQ